MLEKVGKVAGQISIIVTAIIVAMLILEWRERKREAKAQDRAEAPNLAAPAESAAVK